MSQESIALLSLIWTVISSICAAAWVVVPTFIRFVVPRWQEWRYTKLVPSQPGASHLVRLVKLLGKVQGQLSCAQNEIVNKIQRDLGQVEWNVWTEVLPYVDVYSRNEKKRCSALRNLSQAAGRESMTRASEIIRGIATNPWTSGNVKRVADAALEELRERERLEKREASEGGTEG